MSGVVVVGGGGDGARRRAVVLSCLSAARQLLSSRERRNAQEVFAWVCLRQTPGGRRGYVSERSIIELPLDERTCQQCQVRVTKLTLAVKQNQVRRKP